MLKEFDASFDRRIETRAMRSSSMGSTAMPQTGAMATVTKGLFQKSLRDIITGIRANKDRQKDYMNKCLQDIRAEVSVATFVFFAGVEPRRHARARGPSTPDVVNFSMKFCTYSLNLNKYFVHF